MSDDIMKLCVGVGGSLSGEHGIGYEKKEFMDLVFTDDGSRRDDAGEACFQSGRASESFEDFPYASRLHRGRQAYDNEHGRNRQSAWKQFLLGRTMSALTIDGISPARLSRPESVEELAELSAVEKDRLFLSAPARRLGFRESSSARGLRRRSDVAFRITEYNPADLTIHVEAGVTLGQLESALLENNQSLPLDPWNGPSATIGGIAAANAQGPFRATGTIRDWIIGMKVVDIDGRRFQDRRPRREECDRLRSREALYWFSRNARDHR